MSMGTPTGPITNRVLTRMRRDAWHLARAFAQEYETAADLCADPSIAERYDTFPDDHAAAAVIATARALAIAIDHWLRLFQ